MVWEDERTRPAAPPEPEASPSNSPQASPSRPDPGDLGALLGEQADALVEHLDELRVRLIIALGAFLIATVAGWYLVPAVLELFVQAVGRIIFVAPTEAFFARFKIAATVGLVLSLPVILYQLWRFVLPALFPDETRIVRPMVWAGLLLLLGGLGFGYTVVYPVSLAFFLNFGTEGLRPAISISRHLGFVFGTTVSFGLVFQLPIVLLTLVRMGIFTAGRLREIRKPAIFFAFVAAAVMTPSDVVSQMLMAVPLIALYELSVILAPRFEPPTAGVDGEI